MNKGVEGTCIKCGKASDDLLECHVVDLLFGYFCSWECVHAFRGRYNAQRETANQRGWISTSSEFPPEKESVLLCVDEEEEGYRRVVGTFIDVGGAYGCFYEDEGGLSIMEPVTHWQPLPPLPERPKRPESKKRQVGCCEDCQHWVDPYPGGEFAVCNVLTHSSSPYVGATNLAKLGEKFRTNKAFGCTEFQERGDVAPSWIPASEFKR